MSFLTVPRVINYRSQILNGMVPNAWFYRRLIDATIHAGIYRHRQVWSKSLELGTDTEGVTALAGRHRFRTGFGVTKVDFVFLMGLTDANESGGSTANPLYEITLTAEVAATSETKTIAGAVNTVSTITDAPDEQSVAMVTFDVAENTAYTVVVTPSDGARATSWIAYERCEPTTNDEAASIVFNEHQPTGGSPIFDVHRSRILEALSNMYAKNGAISFSWSLYDGSARTRTSNVPVNLIDGSSTGDPVAGTHAGVYLDPRYHRTASRTSVGFELSVYASVAGGGGATVRLRDPSGNTRGSISFTSATPAWYSTTFELPESSELWLSPQFYSDNVNECSVYAIGVQELD